MAAGTERSGQREGADSPLLAALERQLSLGRSRLHMPGHKGHLPFPLSEAARYDFTELPDTDSLYEAEGCLLSLERRYASLYGAADSFLSAGGSTLCIQTMLALLGPDAALCCDRNLHTSAMNAMGLLGQRPFFLGMRRDESGLPLPPAPQDVGRMLTRHPEIRAVYLTSPNYYGYLADIRGIAEAAHAHGALLLVDNAHGAHLPFVEGVSHPLAVGADICCDSLHKLLPALTGAALLHLSGNAPFSRERVKTCMSWFGSTSPSYLILLSVDLLSAELASGLPVRLKRAQRRAAQLRRDFLLPHPPEGESDPLRLVIPSCGEAAALRRLLYREQIEPELCDKLAAVLLFGADSEEEDFLRAEAALRHLPACPALPERDGLPDLGEPEMGCTPREAMLAESEPVAAEEALGRVAASSVQRCPPGAPLVLCGERISRETILLLKNYGVLALNVIK
ncbi:MAG: amino acid decarboxylase [Provencibacterium sp.]|jgi:arginine decarboxylase|nr:amino acid decarboxylase [Provencibacterium sp.]